MKKLFVLITLSLLWLFFLSSCQASIQVSEDNVPEHNASSHIILTEEHGFAFRYADVLFMNEHGVAFIPPPEWFHSPNAVFWIDIAFYTGLGTSLYNFDNAVLDRFNIAFDDSGNFFIPLIFNYSNNQVKKIMKLDFPIIHTRADLRRPDPEVVVWELEQSVLYVNLFVENDYIILFEPKFENETFIYTITRLDLRDGSESVLVNKSFSRLTGTGEVIPNIFVENESIFLYRLKTTLDGNDYFFIDKYDFSGNLIATYPLEIENFLHMCEVDAQDSITRIYKFRDYFILRSLHNRIAILRIEGNNLVEINVPASLQTLGAATLINNFSSDSSFVYFWDFGKMIYIFDPLSEHFFSIEIGWDLPKEHPRFPEDRINNVNETEINPPSEMGGIEQEELLHKATETPML